jgi:isopenicillin-N epimerase
MSFMKAMNNLKAQFLLDPQVIFLNHGSFGATPRPVFAAYQEWQQRLEHQPVHFIVHELTQHLAQARQALGEFIHADPDDIVYVPNATFALNVVARSLDLGPGDEVLASNHEYGACNNVWHFLSQKRGFRNIQQPVSFPAGSPEAMVDEIWSAVTGRTRVIFLSHIASATALRFPVKEICRRARKKGILTIIDGAHAPGQIPIDMANIGADFYFGNAHKWMCSPKGAAFLYSRRDRQPLIEPLVVGWGWGAEWTFTFGSDYLDYLQWIGTNDLSAYLAVPAAIQFQEENNWGEVRRQCHRLLQNTVARINELTGLPPCYPNPGSYQQMAVCQLPPLAEISKFKERLYAEYRVEIPCYDWQDRQFIRISVQGYNTQDDVDALLTALEYLLPEYQDNRPQ